MRAARVQSVLVNATLALPISHIRDLPARTGITTVAVRLDDGREGVNLTRITIRGL